MNSMLEHVNTEIKKMKNSILKSIFNSIMNFITDKNIISIKLFIKNLIKELNESDINKKFIHEVNKIYESCFPISINDNTNNAITDSESIDPENIDQLNTNQIGNGNKDHDIENIIEFFNKLVKLLNNEVNNLTNKELVKIKDILTNLGKKYLFKLNRNSKNELNIIDKFKELVMELNDDVEDIHKDLYYETLKNTRDKLTEILEKLDKVKSTHV